MIVAAEGTTMEELFQAAVVAMYAAKNAGRNLARLHEPFTTIAARRTALAQPG